MPRVPIYDAPQVQVGRQQTQPQAYQQASLPDDPLPKAISGLGASLESAGKTIGEVVQKEQDKIDLAEVLKAKEEVAKINTRYETDASQWGLDVDQEWIDTARKEHAADLEKVKGTLTNAKQSTLFDQFAADARVGFDKTALKTFADRKDKLLDKGYEADKLEALRTIAKNANDPDSLDYNRALDSYSRTVQAYAGVKGLPEKWVDNELSQFNSDAFKATVMNKINAHDYDGAREFYNRTVEGGAEGETVGNSIFDAEGVISGKIKTAEADDKGKALAFSYFNKVKPTSVNKDLSDEELHKQIDADPDATPLEKKFAKDHAKDLVIDYHKTVTANTHATSNAVAKMVNDKNSFASIKQFIAEQADANMINDYQRNSLVDYAETHLGIKEAKAEAKAIARENAREVRRTLQLAKFLDYQKRYDKGEAGLQSPSSATSLVGELGPYTSNFAQYINDSNGKLGKIEIKETDFDRTIEELRATNATYKKLLPDPKSKDAAEQAKQALLRADVRERLQAEHSKQGSKYTLKDALLDASRDVTTEENRFLPNKKQPAYIVSQTPPEEPKTPQAKATVVEAKFRKVYGRDMNPQDPVDQQRWNNMMGLLSVKPTAKK